MILAILCMNVFSTMLSYVFGCFKFVACSSDCIGGSSLGSELSPSQLSRQLCIRRYWNSSERASMCGSRKPLCIIRYELALAPNECCSHVIKHTFILQLAIIYGKVLLQRSYNYSKSAHETNSENILVHDGDKFLPVFQDIFRALVTTVAVSTDVPELVSQEDVVPLLLGPHGAPSASTQTSRTKTTGQSIGKP